MKILGFLLILLGVSKIAMAAEAPVVGRGAAEKYFENAERKVTQYGSDNHYLGLYAGRFMGNSAWDWGAKGRTDDVGNYNIGVTYRMNQYSDSADLCIRFEFDEYTIEADKPLKFSIMPLLTFPDASSKFPLYFGAGAGLGVFFKQIKDASSIALDYQLIMGARFFDVFENVGFSIETGLKNHLHLMNGGQFNGVFLTAGGVFTF